MDRQDRRDQPGLQARSDRPGRKDQRVTLVKPDRKDRKEFRDRKDRKDRKELEVSAGLWDKWEPRDLTDRRAYKAKRESHSSKS